MAYEKVGWKDYPDKTTPINAQNLNHMDDQIAANAEKNDTQDQAIQKNENDISALNFKMDGNATYSMNEVNTHKKWINERDIYRKVYNIATLPANTATCIDKSKYGFCIITEI